MAYVTDHPVRELWAEYRFACPVPECPVTFQAGGKDRVSGFAHAHLLTHLVRDLIEAIPYRIETVLPEREPEPEPFTL